MIYPPAKTGLKPASIRMSFTSSRLSPWISMQPSFNVPPTPQALRIFLASSCFSERAIPVKFLTMVTALPPRCAVWRMMSTRPRLVFFCPRLEVFKGTTGTGFYGPAGRFPSASKAPNALGCCGSSAARAALSFFRLIQSIQGRISGSSRLFREICWNSARRSLVSEVRIEIFNAKLQK